MLKFWQQKNFPKFFQFYSGKIIPSSNRCSFILAKTFACIICMFIKNGINNLLLLHYFIIVLPKRFYLRFSILKIAISLIHSIIYSRLPICLCHECTNINKNFRALLEHVLVNY